MYEANQVMVMLVKLVGVTITMSSVIVFLWATIVQFKKALINAYTVYHMSECCCLMW